eukprot:4935039-Pyramimonas_sp.AAC.1
MLVCVMVRPCRLVRLLRILVLSGCNASPHIPASLLRSARMTFNCRKFGARRSTSSANRKLVSRVNLACPNLMPKPLRSQEGLICRKMCSSIALKR